MRHAAPPRPVFVDRTGRRRRIVLICGVGLATLLVSGLVVLFVGLSAGSGWHVPGFPDANNAVNGGDAGLTPLPTPFDATSEPSPTVSDGAVDPFATPDPTSPRRVPTQTPSHPGGKPTKT